MHVVTFSSLITSMGSAARDNREVLAPPGGALGSGGGRFQDVFWELVLLQT